MDEVSNLSTFDIYSDLLLERHDQGVSVEQLEKTNAENEAQLKELTEQLQNLQSQNAAVVEENKILKANISKLFKTAQAELRRKDRKLEDLAPRRPWYWRESDHKSSINDRLRDLRKNPKEYPRHSNSAVHRNSRVESDSRRSEGSLNSRQTGDVRKPYKQEGEDKESSSRRDARCDGKQTETSSAIESIPNVGKEKNRVKHEEKQAEIRTISKDTDNLSTHSADSYSKDNESRSKGSERTESEREPIKQSRYRIPKKSSSTYDHPLSSREETGRVTSPEPMTSDHRMTDSKKSSHRSTRSPLRYSRGSYKEEKRPRSSRDPLHGRSSERSKSREKSCWYSDRSANRSSVERHSRKKRRLSPDGGSSTPYDSHQDYKLHDIAPRKKHKGESMSEANDREEYSVCSSDKRKLLQQGGIKTHRHNSCSDQEATMEVAPKKRHRSRTSSHHKKKIFTDASLVDEDEHSRKRHKSDRKNKSLKQAKETLHKMHSTARKHKKHKEVSKKHKHRKQHSLKIHKNKDKTEDPDGMPDQEDVGDNDPTRRKKMLTRAEEEGEMPESDFECTVEDFHEEREPNDHDISDMQASLADQANVSVEPSEQDYTHKSEGLKNITAPEIDVEENNEDNVITAAEEKSNRNGFILKDVKIEISQNENLPDVETRQTDLLYDCNDSNGAVKDTNGDKEVTDENTNLHEVIIIDKELPLLRQPDSAACGYSSEHETILVCVPSQEDDSTSESASQSASYTPLSPCRQKNPKHQTVLPQSSHDENGVQLRLCEGQNVSSSEDDGTLWNGDDLTLLRRDTRSIQAHEQTGDVNKSESGVTPEGPVDSDTEFKQTKSISKSENVESTDVLEGISKPVESPTGNIGDSFSERILDVFGSVSFLESDDLESSKEVHISLQSADSFSFQPKDSSLCALQRSPGGDLQHSTSASHQPPMKQDSFLETAQNMFGSNSFLESNDLDSSNGVLSLAYQNKAQSEGEANIEILQSNLAGGNADDEQSMKKQQTKAGSLTETVFEIFGNNSFVEDDNQGMGVATGSSLSTDQPSIQSQESKLGILGRSCVSTSPKMETETMVLSPKEAVLNKGEDKIADSQDSCNILKAEHEESMESPQSEHDKHDLSLAASQCQYYSDLVLKTEDVNRDDSEHPADVFSVTSLEKDNETNPCKFLKSDEIDEDAGISSSLSISDTCFQHPLQKCETVMESENQHCIAEVKDMADISINPPSFDVLSCSASPAHGSLLGDSEYSCHSSRDDRNDYFGKDFKNSDRDYHSDQDVCSQSANRYGNDTPSETYNLSDGEIVSSSDSEVAPPVKTSIHKSGPMDRRLKPKKSKSSRDRSRSRDKQTPSRKDRSHLSKHGKGRHTEGRDRTTFFEEKMKILKERLKARDHLQRQHVNYRGSKSKSDRLYESQSVKREALQPRDERLEPRDRKGHKDEKNVQTAERGDRQGKNKDRRHRESRRVVESERPSSRHSNKAHISRRHDTDQQERHRKKPESGRRTSEERERDKRGRDHRR